HPCPRECPPRLRHCLRVQLDPDHVRACACRPPRVQCHTAVRVYESHTCPWRDTVEHVRLERLRRAAVHLEEHCAAEQDPLTVPVFLDVVRTGQQHRCVPRSEEHTSELQS